jgi:hypothetical protein
MMLFKKKLMNNLQKNAATLHHEFQWLGNVINARFQAYFNGENTDVLEVEILETNSAYAQLVQQHDMSFMERIVLLLALSPHIVPQILDVFFIKNKTYDRDFSEFGGITGTQHKGFLPTGETAAFILAGNDFGKRLEVQSLFDAEHFFAKEGILKLEHKNSNEPLLSGQLVLSKEFIHYFTEGTEYHPKFSSQFPAERLTTEMEWEDLILPDLTMEEVKDVLVWLKHNDTLMNEWGMSRKLKRGFRMLFYGPPGTGKTLTASLLGKQMDMEVYRVDLSQIVSKYIGETEKNMGSLFDQAENRNWILFFDEADALFGSRTATSSSNDKHANQEVAYLLQRVEDYPGVVILASNLKGNIDEAFSRRFQSMILFPIPNADERHRLWKSIFSKKVIFDGNIDLFDIAEEYELAGGAIINVVRYASLKALSRNTNMIELNDILQGIKREFRKEGKTISI